MKRIIIIPSLVFLLTIYSINIYSQKNPDDLGRIIYQSYKDGQLQSINKNIITHNQLIDFLKENNIAEMPSKEIFEKAQSQFKGDLDSIYQRGIREGITWSKVELVSVESEIHGKTSLIDLLMTYQRHEIKIRFSLNIERQGKWYIGMDVSSDFMKYDYDNIVSEPKDTLKVSGNTFLETGIYELSEAKNGFLRLISGSTDSLYVNPDKAISNNHITKVSFNKSKSGHGFSLKMEFNEAGKELLSQLTEKNTWKRIAFVFNDKLIQAPKILMRIDTGTLLFDGIHLDNSDMEFMVDHIKKHSSGKKN